MAGTEEPWTPSSWRSKTIAQDVNYPDRPHLDRVLKKLQQLPPLVTSAEVDKLRDSLAEVAHGRAFLLQGGDCAEAFEMCSEGPIEAKIQLILLMSLIIVWGARVPVVRIGRIAGQYAKPRSKPTEMVDGKEVLSFRGDNVNGLSPDDRTPDPERLLSAYFHSSTTMNYIRALLSSGFADLHKSREWSFAHVRSKELQHEYEGIVSSLKDSLDFMKVIGAESGVAGSLSSVDFYISHEALLLEYEEALTRKVRNAHQSRQNQSRSTSVERGSMREVQSSAQESTGKPFYNSGAHFIWIGDRTRQLDGAHVEYFRGLRNPVGIKVGPTMTGDELKRILDIVDPDCEAGKVTLISRYGAGKVRTFLPGHIKAVQESGHLPIFACDPMHGNTRTSETDSNLKTRRFADIIDEITLSIAIHAECNSRFSGVHLELTGEIDANGVSVTECVGGSMELQDQDLGTNYRTFCDPRLNLEQGMDCAFLISNYLKNQRNGDHAPNKLLGQLRGRI